MRSENNRSNLKVPTVTRDLANFLAKELYTNQVSIIKMALERLAIDKGIDISDYDPSTTYKRELKLLLYNLEESNESD